VGDIIVEDDVWPWAAGESMDEVFAAEEDLNVAVFDDRGKRVRRPLLPLVLRDSWQLVVAHRLTGAVLFYTLVPHSPYGIGRDPAVCFGEEVVLRIFSFLDVHCLHVIALVSQTWKRISEDNSLWRAKALEGKPFLQNYLLKVFGQSKAPWRTIYRTLNYPHRWSEEQKAKEIYVTAKGLTAIVMGITRTNLSIQSNRPIYAGAELFWYFEVVVNHKESQWNIGFGITDSQWDKEIKFIGYDRESYNYGYTSNGKMRGTAKYDGFPTYRQGDRLGFWLEYNSPRMDITLHVFLNDVLIHSWQDVYEKHQPPLYFTATLYQDGTQVSFVTSSVS